MKKLLVLLMVLLDGVVAGLIAGLLLSTEQRLKVSRQLVSAIKEMKEQMPEG